MTNGYVTTMTVADTGTRDDGTPWVELREGSSGCSPRVPADHGLKVGDAVTVTFTSCMGEVAAIDHDGRRILDRDDTTRAAEHRRSALQSELDQVNRFLDGGRTKLDAAYASLPAVFRRRIDKFRDTKGPSWRWEFESYESMVCVDAVKISEACGVVFDLEPGWGTDSDELRGQVSQWLADNAEAVEGIDRGHSGNSFGFARRLAGWWLVQPELVVADHGALVPLVGCIDYGCPHDPSGDDAA